VVGHLEDLGGEIGTGGPQQLLGLHLYVAGEQHPVRSHGGPQHDRAVVGIRPGAACRQLRPEHVQSQPTEQVGLAGGQRAHGDTVRGSCGSQHPVRWSRFGQRPDSDQADPPPAQHAGQPADVVGVQVGEHQHRDGRDRQPAQAPVDGGRVGSGVHDHRRTVGGRHGERVALSHIAGHQQPAGRRPARGDRTDR